MDALGPTLEGVAAILWPLLFILLISRFSPSLNELIQSARSRKFTVKVGSNEITMEQAAEQQQSLIADLQKGLLELRAEVAGIRPIGVRPPADELESPLKDLNSVLWVDDVPENNSYIVSDLEKQGVQVVIATSTSDGLRQLQRREFSRVVTDMGRAEQGGYNATAGIDLVEAIRQTNQETPVIVFCSTRAVNKYRDRALAAGASEVTSSAVALLSALKYPSAASTQAAEAR